MMVDQPKVFTSNRKIPSWWKCKDYFAPFDCNDSEITEIQKRINAAYENHHMEMMRDLYGEPEPKKGKAVKDIYEIMKWILLLSLLANMTALATVFWFKVILV